MEANMESSLRNVTKSASAKDEYTHNTTAWPRFAPRSLLSLGLLVCATAAIGAHDIYSGPLNKESQQWGSIDAIEGLAASCAIPPPSKIQAPSERTELVGRFVRVDGGQPLVRRISSRGETLAAQDFPVRVSADGRIDICLRPDPEGELGV